MKLSKQIGESTSPARVGAVDELEGTVRACSTPDLNPNFVLPRNRVRAQLLSPSVAEKLPLEFCRA